MQMLILFTLCQSLCATALLLEDEVWQKWKQTHGKVYNGEGEESMRRRQFESNADIIARHNAKYEHGLSSFALGFNQFADLSAAEFKRLYLSSLKQVTTIHTSHVVSTPARHSDTFDPPKSIDWRKKGLVTPVEDQGTCGSCWAFSAIGSIEGQYAKQNGTLLAFSKQQLVDCSHDYGNNGCGGGLMDNAFKYLEDFGLETESDYPYVGEDQYCTYDTNKTVTGVIGIRNVVQNDENDLKNKVAQYGPVSVAIDADHKFHLYTKGIFISDVCSSQLMDLNHGVLAVGYGTLGRRDYWIIKNSWGTSWGEKGYLRFARNRKNMCGIATAASLPIV